MDFVWCENVLCLGGEKEEEEGIGGGGWASPNIKSISFKSIRVQYLSVSP